MRAFPYVKMTQDDAKWKHPDLRKVRRVGGSGVVVDVPVGYGEAPNAQPACPAHDPRVAETNGHVDEETESGGVPVEVQWGDVVELWEYDPHPFNGARPSSLASSLVVHAHTGEGVHSDLIEGSTPWTSHADCANGKTMTPEEVAEELGLAANHWAGDHSGCGQLGRISRCVTEGWGIETTIYEKGSEIDKAVQD
ncbi:unnamed protein product [Closterium sp. NIES-65]|nr:unnamed protein product [Closterium sp. NIES-65]